MSTARAEAAASPGSNVEAGPREEGETNLAKVLFEYAPEAFYLSDLHGRFTDGNREAEELIGCPREKLIGSSFLELDLLSVEDLTRAAALLARNAAGEPTGPDEFELKRPDGRRVIVEIRTHPVRLRGRVLILGIARDVTSQKRLEAQLRQAQKMEAVGQLAGGVAHDFNNMLAVMRGSAELLLLDPERLSPSQHECLKHLIGAAERAAGLTRQLLLFSRKQVMEARPLSGNDLVRNLAKMLKRVIRENITLDCRLENDLPCVQADPGMIEQVLLNLVINARDAMPRGGRLEIATEKTVIDEAYTQSNAEASAGEFVCLSVRDTGTGIAPEHLPRIFEPFFTTKEPGIGTGLGLATVYGIVKQHRGWVEVSSHVGEGTTFRVYLRATPGSMASGAEPAAAAAPRGGTETVLLVEDDDAVRMITRQVLEAYNYRVLEATCAREAIALCEQHLDRINLLLSDIMLPEAITGRELADSLRARRPDLKVILMSGYSPDVVSKDTTFFRRPSLKFLQKPCNTSTLLQTVRDCLDNP